MPDVPVDERSERERIDRLLEKEDYRSFSAVEISALQDEVRRLRTALEAEGDDHAGD